jgi:hypothetical protein
MVKKEIAFLTKIRNRYNLLILLQFDLLGFRIGELPFKSIAKIKGKGLRICPNNGGGLRFELFKGSLFLSTITITYILIKLL